MNIIFFGSDDFAVVNLEKILESGQEVCACVTPPDKPKGRHLHLMPCPVTEFARAKKIPALQPADIRDEKFLAQVRKYNADLFVVIAYGKILPPQLLEVPKICAVNSHASLLPRYRGAAPINWAIIRGEEETGISLIRMNAKMDAGDIIAQSSTRIEPQDTAVTLRARLAKLSAECLCETIPRLAKKNFPAIPQDIKKVSLAPKLTKELGLIDWKKSAQEIHNLVRGLVPWPTAYTHLRGKLLKVLETAVVALPLAGHPGEILKIDNEGILVTTGNGVLLLRQVQPESGKVMNAHSFAVGHKIAAGLRFGGA